MISSLDLYHVMTAITPLYVSMLLAYTSVKHLHIFSPSQCSGINRFVALFAVPLLSFHFISSNNPFSMNLRFLAADSLQKLFVLASLTLYASLSPRRRSLQSSITFFSLSTLPNTLVLGIPLLSAMYGPSSASLIVQLLVLQCILWYTFLLFLFEYRAAALLIAHQFPGNSAAAILSIAVESDVVSLDGTEVEARREDGGMRVVVRRSSASRSEDVGERRASNLTNAEIYSLASSRNATPRGSSFNRAEVFSMGGRGSNCGAGDGGVGRSTPRSSNCEEEGGGGGGKGRLHYQIPGAEAAAAAGKRDWHMFVWSSSASPVSEGFGAGGNGKEVRVAVSPSQGKQTGWGRLLSWCYLKYH